MFMDYNELKILFQKYQEGKITREEFYLLQKQVNMHSDKTLQPIYSIIFRQARNAIYSHPFIPRFAKGRILS